MLEILVERVQADPGLIRRGRHVTTTFLLERHGPGPDPQSWLIAIRDGVIVTIQRGPHVMPSWTFALRASGVEWDAFWQSDPRPGHHDLMALIKRRALRVEGDIHPFMANLRYFKELLALPRNGAAAS